jgi:hypothetical protein
MLSRTVHMRHESVQWANVRTIFRDNRVYIQNDNRDVAHRERICEQLAHARCTYTFEALLDGDIGTTGSSGRTSSNDHNLIAPIQFSWTKEHTSLVPVQLRVPPQAP